MTTTRDTAPVLLRSLRKKRLAAALFRGLRETRDVLIELGHPDPLSYELHVPMPVQKSGMLAALEIARHLDVVHKRTLYGNLAGLGGDQTGDVKILHRAPCSCKSDCSCTELCEVCLPGLVHDVVSVDIDGKTLPPEVYRVDAPGRLVRVDGGL
ncbi:hypothetical protein [Streptomyces sp. ME19-01-6]|uniref:hypothetical protein n=1 Tax=Streptomyces sp. ME19-01-6 TaxID=3028686 RepID=UPI0029B34FA3|nr:hypothetical protein [Streptomyces sp. ME19-01-6]MDX3229577.1 hypothetical protein [Streptomyces sp. ME19-01-6]